MDKAVPLSYSLDEFITFQGGKKFPSAENEPDEVSWFCPRELGYGTFQRIKIRKGFDLWLSDCTFHQDVVFKDSQTPALMQFSFTLSGHYYVCYTKGKKTVQYCGEHQSIGYHHEFCATCRVLHNVPVRYVSLTLSPDFFAAFFEEHLRLMPPLIHNILADNTDSGYLYQSAITPVMREVMQQILDCPYHGITRKLFLESKSLELLSLQLNQISSPPQLSYSSLRMHPQDKKQIEEVRAFIETNLDTPPCLNDLAKQAGMSHPKLNRCFKQVYGMTVFQYLRTERLNRARTMLREQGYSVTEAAFQVGYDSVSHFSQMYKKQFGNSPSKLLP